MDDQYRWDKIVRDDFDKALALYPSSIPEKLKPLDEERLHIIPDKVKSRHEPYLEKDELVNLVRWKLSHGTFRPRLLTLAQSNTDIPSTTRLALSQLLTGTSTNSTPTPESLTAPLKHLTTLSGVGPATASLVLSVASPDRIPFFADELYRWLVWDVDGAGDKALGVKGGKGWGRGIAYSVKEYGVLVERLGRVRERIGRGAGEVEMVAYVLGKLGVEGMEECGLGTKAKAVGGDEGVGKAKAVGGDEGTGKAKALGGDEGVGKVKRKRKTAEEVAAKQVKVEDENGVGSGVRRSARRSKTGT